MRNIIVSIFLLALGSVLIAINFHTVHYADKENLTIEDLILMRNKGNIFSIDSFVNKSTKWRSPYLDIKRADTQAGTWYKDKDIRKPVEAEDIDILIYQRPVNFSSVIMFRTSNKTSWEEMLQVCRNTGTEKIETNDFQTRIYAFEKEGCLIKLGDMKTLYSVMVMNIQDYKKGLRIQ